MLELVTDNWKSIKLQSLVLFAPADDTVTWHVLCLSLLLVLVCLSSCPAAGRRCANMDSLTQPVHPTPSPANTISLCASPLSSVSCLPFSPQPLSHTVLSPFIHTYTHSVYSLPSEIVKTGANALDACRYLLWLMEHIIQYL